jgi:hypothetical protein
VRSFASKLVGLAVSQEVFHRQLLHAVISWHVSVFVPLLQQLPKLSAASFFATATVSKSCQRIHKNVACNVLSDTHVGRVHPVRKNYLRLDAWQAEQFTDGSSLSATPL